MNILNSSIIPDHEAYKAGMRTSSHEINNSIYDERKHHAIMPFNLLKATACAKDLNIKIYDGYCDVSNVYFKYVTKSDWLKILDYKKTLEDCD